MAAADPRRTVEAELPLLEGRKRRKETQRRATAEALRCLAEARRALEQESGSGASQALVAVDELIPQLQVYLGDEGSDARERTRTINLLDQLKGHGLVSALDSHDRVVIRPIITHLANPENLQALLHWLREQAAARTAGNEDRT